MSTLNDVQDAIVAVIDPVVYPLGDNQPSILGSRISTITVNAGGTGYTTATVSFTGGGGTGSMAQAIIVLGVIVQIIVIPGAGGYNYASAPTVVITGDGSGAAATATISPIQVSIASGDFLKQNMDIGLANNDVFVSVFAIHAMTRNTTRYRREYAVTHPSDIQTPTLTVTTSGNTATIGGTVTSGQTCVVLVNGTGYAYMALNADTTTTIAAALADLIPDATSFGAVITVSGTPSLIGRVSVPGTARRILHSQESVMRVRIVAAHNEIREMMGAALQVGIAENDYFLQMPDEISAFIKPYNSGINEANPYEMSNAFVRDYLYLVEYHTVQSATFHTITDPYVIENVGIVPIS